jgi:hypothetical protein
MEINDLNGKEITIDNFDLAIMQADDFCHYRHSDPAFAELDKALQSYWRDIYQKLLALKEAQN